MIHIDAFQGDRDKSQQQQGSSVGPGNWQHRNRLPMDVDVAFGIWHLVMEILLRSWATMKSGHLI